MSLFIGRDTESAEFAHFLQKPTASLIVCQGRRRIGKSTFFRHAAASAGHFLAFEGLPPRAGQTKQDQLAAFAERLAAQTKVPQVRLDSWPQAFQLLASALPPSGTVVVLLDEISWLAQGDPDFPGHLKAAWDNLFSVRPRLILVLCGSVSSWIQNNILNNTGFTGRCSWQLTLPPLALPACNRFWRGKPVSAAEKLKILAVTGGVPRYLEEIDPAKSAEQNIDRLCFRRGGLLFHEFDQIFHDIFTRRAETYRDIVRSLVTGPRSIAEISHTLKQGRGGTLSAAVSDLELAGFVGRETAFDPDSAKSLPRTIRYRIRDNYLRFYLKYIEPAAEQIKAGLYDRVPLESLQAWDTIMGLQFENLVLTNLPQVFDRMGLDRVPVLNAGPYFQAKTSGREACQIDLLVRTKNSLYVGEIKFRRRIEPTVIDEVKQKLHRLDASSASSIRTVLIYQGELSPEIPRADFFDHLIPFEALLSGN